jgi:hypothetical protein
MKAEQSSVFPLLAQTHLPILPLSSVISHRFRGSRDGMFDAFFPIIADEAVVDGAIQQRRDMDHPILFTFR